MKNLKWKYLVKLGFKPPLNKKIKTKKLRVSSSYYGECQLNLQRFKAHYHNLRTSYLNKLYKSLSLKYKGNVQEHLVRVLESRLDSILYRSNLVNSQAQSSQIILHKHVLINGKPVNIRSYIVKLNDEITLDKKVHHLLNLTNLNMIPPYLSYDINEYKLRLTRLITLNDIKYETEIDFNMVINALRR